MKPSKSQYVWGRRDLLLHAINTTWLVVVSLPSPRRRPRSPMTCFRGWGPPEWCTRTSPRDTRGIWRQRECRQCAVCPPLSSPQLSALYSLHRDSPFPVITRLQALLRHNARSSELRTCQLIFPQLFLDHFSDLNRCIECPPSIGSIFKTTPYLPYSPIPKSSPTLDIGSMQWMIHPLARAGSWMMKQFREILPQLW